jgi:hypothetical protein
MNENRQEIFKVLKKRKVFGKYCLACAQAFYESKKPRDRVAAYERVFKHYASPEEFADAVKRWAIDWEKIKII